MAGLLEKYAQGLFGLAPVPAPNGVFGQALDSAAQWGRGAQDKWQMLGSTLADLLKTPQSALPNLDPQKLSALMQQPVSPEMKQQVAQKALDFGMEFGPLTFIGKGAKTWSAAMAQKAQELEAAGVDTRKIWQETGTWKAPDGQWRQEIPDNVAGFKKSGISDIYSFGYRPQEKVFSHNELYSAYPDAGKIQTTYASGDIAKEAGNYGAHFSPEENMISLSVPRKNADLSKATSSNIHELQHAVQEREGFAKGGSPENFDPKTAERARDILSYRKEIDNYIAKNWPNAKNEFEVRSNADNALRQEYYRLGAHDMLPSHEIISEAISPNYNAGTAGRQQLEQMVKEFGLDKKVTPNSAMDMYRRLAGEAEARATQARLPLNAAQRRATFPADSYDVPLDQLIIRR